MNTHTKIVLTIKITLHVMILARCAPLYYVIMKTIYLTMEGHWFICTATCY